MRASAEWSPKLRWLSSRILLFIPSSRPLLSLHVTHAMTPSKWLRIIFAARLTGYILELIARRSHPRRNFLAHVSVL